MARSMSWKCSRAGEALGKGGLLWDPELPVPLWDWAALSVAGSREGRGWDVSSAHIQQHELVPQSSADPTALALTPLCR